MERQALRRVEAGGLDDETVERLGSTLMALADRMEELKQTFGLRDLNLNARAARTRLMISATTAAARRMAPAETLRRRASRASTAPASRG
jgi:hypothetical protein